MKNSLTELRDLLDKTKEDEAILSTLSAIAEKMLACLKGGGKILIAGNGGSAADAQHFAAEIVGRYKKERQGYPAIALTVDTSALTAIGNDYSFDEVFSRQVEALGRHGDMLFGFSTSGDSKNIIKAVEKGKEKGMTTVCFLGKGGGMLKGMSAHEIIVASDNTPRIQEVHGLMIHMICEAVDSEL
jgi:D-sedoheptulose 7-phosphate isomerase